MNAPALVTSTSLNPNPFEVHGIRHLSPSTCGKFVASPAMFVLDKLLKVKTAVGAAAHRGTAVEDGVAHGLFNPKASLEECQAVAHAKFSKLTALSTDPKLDKERGGLDGFVQQALAALRPYGVPDVIEPNGEERDGERPQFKVSVEVPGLAVPIIGYTDFKWERHGIIIDEKTTWACPSEISTSHARQGSLYKKATGFGSMRFNYTTPKRSEVYELDNAEGHFQALANIALTIQRFLALSADKHELAQLVAPDCDHYYFNDPLARQAAFDVWGI